ncbi:hypothetical protein KW786_03865 [Candidatus Parcubacteria bacterium]|nr:hypothetical protein [Candidatus Parcubacteria bacterium]
MISDMDRYFAFEGLHRELAAIVCQARAQVPSTANRLNYLNSGFALLAPWDGNRDLASFEIIHQSENYRKGSLRIYLLFSDDAKIGGLAENERFFKRKMKTRGFYSADTHMITIYVDQDQETLRRQAFILLHELGHVPQFMERGIVFTDTILPNQERILMEKEMWTADYQIALAIGGDRYRQLAKANTERLAAGFQRVQPAPLAEGAGVALDHCFGLAVTPEIRKERDWLFDVYCTLHAIDSFSCDQSVLEAKKCEFIARCGMAEKI